jgi:hypothetical protein
MNRIIAAVKLKVRCVDGCTHEGVTLAVEDNRRVYLAADGTQLEGVHCIDECVSVLPPRVLAAVLSQCKECEQ